MSRSATTLWTRRVRRRFSQTTAELGELGPGLDDALAAVSQRLKIDPVVLLGALATEPRPGALWNEIERHARGDSGPRMTDWNELAAAAELVTSSLEANTVSCWIAEPADPMDVFALASCLALAPRAVQLSVVATHSDPVVAEIGQSGLLPETSVRAVPASHREVHFRHLGHCWQVAPALRAAVRFVNASPFHDALNDGDPVSTRYDLVVSRGRLSRLSPSASQRLTLRLLRAVRSGGFLLVGPGEHDQPPFTELERCVAPGVLLYRKRRANRSATANVNGETDFASLLTAVEANPTAWEPRWELACVLLREGHAEPAVAHLREVARRRPDEPLVWRALAQAYTLLGNTVAAKKAEHRALPSGAVANAA